MRKKLLLLFLCTGMALTTGACGKKAETPQTPPHAPVVAPEQVHIGAGEDSSSGMQSTKTKTKAPDTATKEAAETATTDDYDWTRSGNTVDYDVPDEDFFEAHWRDFEVKDETYPDEMKTAVVQQSKTDIQKYQLKITEADIGNQYDAAMDYLAKKYPDREIKSMSYASSDGTRTTFGVDLGDGTSRTITVEGLSDYKCSDDIAAVDTIQDYEEKLKKIAVDNNFPVRAVAANLYGQESSVTADELLNGEKNILHIAVFYMRADDINLAEHKDTAIYLKEVLEKNTKDNIWCTLCYTMPEEGKENGDIMGEPIAGQYEFKVGNPKNL